MEELDRRALIKKGAITIAVTSTCVCGLGGCAAYTKVSRTPAVNPAAIAIKDNVVTVDLSKEPNLSRIGGAVKVVRADIPESLMIARVGENRFDAVSLLCTHRGVELEYDHGQTRFECPSIGNSVFALNGQNVSGPASRSLKRYAAFLKSGTVTIVV